MDLSSPSTTSWTIALTAFHDISSPSAFSVPSEKNVRSATRPRGVCIHFSLTARETVATWMPSMSATSTIGSGFRCCGPCSNHSRCRARTTRTTRMSVVLRCSIASMIERAARTLSATKLRALVSSSMSFIIAS